MNWFVFFLVVVLSNFNTFTKAFESKPEVKAETKETEFKDVDCSGLLTQREFGQADGRSFMRNGEYAAGQHVGRNFVPVIYFNTLNVQLPAPKAWKSLNGMVRLGYTHNE
jgi:hypothetical protein